MINELLTIEKQLIDLGINLADEWHNKLATNPKTNKALLVRVSDNGRIFSITDNPQHEHLRQYRFTSSQTAPTFRFEKKNHIGRFQATIKLVKLIECRGSEKLNALRHLATCLSKTTVDQFWEDFKAIFPEAGTVATNVALEVSDDFRFPVPVQSPSTFEELNKVLFEMNTNKINGTDSLGGNGTSNASFEHKISLGNMYVYSRNDDNKIFERYRKNGFELFNIGQESRNRLIRIINVALSQKEGSPVACASFAPKNSNKLVIVSTLMPDATLVRDSKLSLDDWRERCALIMNKLTTQQPVSYVGNFTVFSRPSTGAWSIDFSQRFSRNEVEEAVKCWDLGIRNSIDGYLSHKRSPRAPTLVSIAKLMNCRFAWDSKKKEFRKAHESSMWAFRDSVCFFSGEQYAIEKAARILVSFLLPVMTECAASSIVVPEMLCEFYSVLGIIFYRNAIMEENLSNDPMFCLGRLFNEADRIHRAFFTTRNCDPPEQTLGFRHYRIACDDPEYALRLFVKKFSLYQNWAQNRYNKQCAEGNNFDKSYSWLAFCEAMSKSASIPAHPGDMDFAKLGAGYLQRKPRASSADEKTAVD